MFQGLKVVAARVEAAVRPALASVVVGASVALVGRPAMAQTAPTGPDFSTLTSGISFTTVVTAIMAVAAASTIVYIAIAGVKWVIGRLRAL